MSHRTAGFGLGLSLLLAGCVGCGSMRPGGVGLNKDQPGAASAAVPEAARLIAYLNDNADRVQAVQCNKVSIDCKQGNQSVGLEGLLACQKPRDFRLKAKVLGQAGADIGSNDKEFWFWISKNEPIPYVFHCSYTDLARGNVELPFPFHPEMIMSALGIGHYDPSKAYEVRASAQTIELSERATSPAGQPITKITVFQRNEVSPATGKPQVIAHVIKDARGQDVCIATIQEVTLDRATNAVLPTKVKIVWPGDTPARRAEMTMRFYEMRAAPIDPARAATLFSREDLAGQQSFDLGRRVADGVGGAGGVSQTQSVDLGSPRTR